MRRATVWRFLALLALLPAARCPADTSSELTKLEKNIVDAVVKRDAAFLKRAFAPECTIVSSDGTLMLRDQALATFASGKMALESITLEKVKVRPYGDTAVMTGLQHVKIRGSAPDTFGSRFTSVFVKRDGRWQQVAYHSTKVPAPAGK